MPDRPTDIKPGITFMCPCGCNTEYGVRPPRNFELYDTRTHVLRDPLTHVAMPVELLKHIKEILDTFVR